MAQRGDTSEPHQDDLADLSALADGSLDPARRAAVGDRIAGSSELRTRYEREVRAVEVLHEAAARDRAPASLRTRVEELGAGGARRGRRPERGRATPAGGSRQRPYARRRVAVAGALSAALAVAALALVLLLPAGTPGSPTLSQAASLALREPVGSPPVPDPAAPTARLATTIQDLHFPVWTGWEATGQRADSLSGREAVTVYYRSGSRRVAYTILARPALGVDSGRVTWRNGTELYTLTVDGREVVTWQRGAHTCVLSGARVSVAELQKLAAAGTGWEDR